MPSSIPCASSGACTKVLHFASEFRTVKERFVTRDFPASTILGVASLRGPTY